MNNWFETCNRKMFFDYHNPGTARDVAADFDAVRWARALREAGVQGVNCFAKCACGYRYYRKGRVGYVHPNLPEGVDMLEETIASCHAQGIRVIAYVHTFGSEPVCRDHPEWRLRNADGTARGNYTCMLGGLLEGEMLPQIAEIAGNYDVDGMFFDATFHEGMVCYCDDCRARFRDATGLELPIDPEDPACEAYLRWADAEYIRVRARVVEIVRRANPKALSAINWAYSARFPENVPDDIGFLTIDISPQDMALQTGLQARNWALGEKPFDIMNHMSLKSWQEFGIKPLPSLEQECALALVQGGKDLGGVSALSALRRGKAAL